jgi:hypothetical protein
MEFYAANTLNHQVDKPEEAPFKFDDEIGNGARQA